LQPTISSVVSEVAVNPPVEQRALGRRILKGFAVATMAGVLVIATLLAALRLEHEAAITLPAPTGAFAVVRAIYDWRDEVNLDPLAPVAGTKRELLVWIWYPAVAERSMAADDYVPPALGAEVERDLGPVLGGLFTRNLAKVRAHSIRNAEVSREQRSYPIVIMRAGASAEIWNYSTLAEDLASHGYVVVGFDAPYRTNVVVFPDGRVMRRMPENNPELCEGQEQAQRDRCVSRVMSAWIADIGFVLDRLEQLNSSDAAGKFHGRLDMTRIGVFGHSFGGATAAEFCHDDSRCKAGVDVDGQPFGNVIQDGLHQPFMFLMGDHRRESDGESRQIMANIQSIYDRAPADGRLFITIRGANHFLFSDDGALLKSQIVMRTLRAFGVVGMDGRRQLAATAYCLRTFFDAHLKGAGDPRLKIASPLYPEIEVLK
jgi:predicted dienelactone hydrolase